MSDFDTLVTKVLRREGGYVNNRADRGGETNFGISKRANPDVDIKSLTPEKAKEIYRDRYWKPLGADNLPENVRDLAFDTAVHHGVGTARAWLREVGNDPQKLLERRRAALQKQGRKADQAQFVNGWMKRLAEFDTGGTMAPASAPAAARVQPAQTPLAQAAQDVFGIGIGPRIARPDPADEPSVQLPELPRASALSLTQAQGGNRDLTPALDTALFNERVRQESRATTLEQFGASMASNIDSRLFRSIMRRTRDEFPADPTFELPYKELNGMDSESISRLSGARSQAEYDQLKADMDEDNLRAKTIFQDGMGKGLVLSFAGEAAAVTNWVAPYAAFRSLGQRALVAGRAGQTGRAIGIGVGEAVVSGTAIELTAQALEGNFDAGNLFLAATVDAAIGTAVGGAAVYSTRLERAAMEQVQREAQMMTRIVNELGEGTTPQQARAEFARQQANQIKEPLVAASSPIPTERKFFDAPDEVEGDAPSGGAPEAGAGTTQPPQSPAPVAAPKLPAALAGAKPRYSFGNKQFELEFENDLDRAFYIIAGNKPSKKDSEYIAWLSSQYPNASVAELRKTGQALRTAIKAAAKDAPAGKLNVPSTATPAASPERGGVGTIDMNSPQAKQAMTIIELEEAYGQGIATPFENPVLQQNRVMAASKGNYNPTIKAIAGDEIPTFEAVSELGNGVTVTKAAMADVTLRPAINAVKSLIAEYLPKSRVVFGNGTSNPAANGEVVSFGKTHIIGVRTGDPTRVTHTAVHEVGHAVYHEMIGKMPAEFVMKLRQEWLDWVALARTGDPTAVQGRFAITSPNAGVTQLKTSQYGLSFDEWMAEQFVKHVEKRINDGAMGNIDKGVVSILRAAMQKLLDFFTKSKAKGLLDVNETADEFFTTVLNKSYANTNRLQGKPADAGPVSAASAPVQTVNDFLTDPIAQKYGLIGLPMSTAAERADAKMILNIYRKADEWAARHPMDDAWNKRADQLIDNSLVPAASTGLRLLKSENPVARMMAAELLEDASGVAGKRQSTAAIAKYMAERRMIGNAIPEFTRAYEGWRKASGGSIKDDFIGGEYYDRFNKRVFEEIENRRKADGPVSNDPYIKAAADSTQAAFERIRKDQINSRTLGWQALPESSVGYVPHKISPGRWMQLSNEQRQVVQQALVDQFITIEGWDMTFADNLAARYVERVQARATGGHDSPIGGANAGSAEIIEDALLAMGMSADEVRKNMQRFNRGAAGWTKGRIDLDMTKPYTVEGQEFKLMDVFDTDVIQLLRSQAGRASGEVALARHGIYGRPHMQVLRKAMTYGTDTGKATNSQLEAFDQIAAEFINAPFGTAEPKWMENARILNSVVRLGGIVFNQFGEFVNGIVHVGLTRTLRSIGAMGRMRGEIKQLVAGQQVNNPLIGSIEKLGGAEFGTDAYRIVMPFDSPDHAYPTYGRDTVTNFDRLVRGASYAQAKLSGWRMVHSVQQRAMAEQIVAKIGRYVKDGGEDEALRQFGITPEIQAALKADGVARFDGDSLVEFDVTKMQDPVLREQLIQSVHRGVSQIIQGTFIGETGKWAHDGYLKMLVQFRTFSLTAMEKQWARQRNGRGVAKALGILVASMGAVAPIYMARVYASSIGREDQEEFLEERLKPELIIRQTLNYVALSGLLGDFLDAAAALAPEELGLRMTGGRAGTDTEFVGNLIAPSLSLVDDAWKALQNLDDPEKLARVLPGSRLPYVLPAVNALGD